MRDMWIFAVVTLAPAVLIALASVGGGLWAALALISMTGLVAGLDLLVRRVPEARPGQEFPAADGLSVVLALVHLLLLPLTVWAVAGGSHLGWGATLAVGLAAGMWFGQVSNSNAHELIHRSDRWLYRLGVLVYVSLLFGHHASAHRLVHHRYVGTADDPNTPRKDEGFYQFAGRAWIGSYRAGRQAERGRRKDRSRSPYPAYGLGALAFLALSYGLGGWRGVIAHLALAGYATMQLLLSDYVQHYGLVRPVTDGRPAPIGPDLSWNAPHWYSARLMLNAPRHSDHHSHPGRKFPELRLAPTGREPMLPAALPVMAALALVPPVWKRVMNRRLAELRGPDVA